MVAIGAVEQENRRVPTALSYLLRLSQGCLYLSETVGEVGVLGNDRGPVAGTDPNGESQRGLDGEQVLGWRLGHRFVGRVAPVPASEQPKGHGEHSRETVGAVPLRVARRMRRAASAGSRARSWARSSVERESARPDPATSGGSSIPVAPADAWPLIRLVVRDRCPACVSHEPDAASASCGGTRSQPTTPCPLSGRGRLCHCAYGSAAGQRIKRSALCAKREGRNGVRMTKKRIRAGWAMVALVTLAPPGELDCVEDATGRSGGWRSDHSPSRTRTPAGGGVGRPDHRLGW